MDHEDLQKDAEFPFTKESLWKTVSVIVIIFAAGLFLSWFFFAPSDDNGKLVEVQNQEGGFFFYNLSVQQANQ